ncbi:MAG TPA: NAD-dependent deacylase [Elusimicrobia bacterium]|nr:NAD-dependent deacylase [Elusimicrobiota bacterium]
MKKDPFELARSLCSKARRVCALTGAGISAESGLATFRDAGGLWEGHRVEDVATPEAFRRDPRLVWQFYNARRKAGAEARPNPAHLALAKLEERAQVSVLTQNVDGLHGKAGSTRVVELHGSLWRVRCTGECPPLAHAEPLELAWPTQCKRCGELLRPDIVWFGEALDPKVLEESARAMLESEVFLVIGTSALVQPAASIAFEAVRRGIPVVEVNRERTPLSKLASATLLGKAGELLPKLLKA